MTNMTSNKGNGITSFTQFLATKATKTFENGKWHTTGVKKSSNKSAGYTRYYGSGAVKRYEGGKLRNV